MSLIKKLTAALLFSAVIFGVFPTAASASFGSGTAVIAEKLCLIKTAYFGEKICFRDTDFKSTLGVADFKKITITSLPDPKTGTLVYAGRRCAVGQTVKRRNIPSLVFLPASDTVTGASFTFTAEGLADGRVIECAIKFTGKLNKAPSVATPTVKLTVSENGGKTVGKIDAQDPEGDSLEYFIACYPKHGAVKLSQDGVYTYTRCADFRTSDSFSYIVRDRWGNWSEAVKVKITDK